MNISIKRKLANLKTKLAEIYQDRLAFLYLFGSQARDTAEEGSDIDILVVLSGDVDPNLERSRTLDIIADLSLENDVVISCIFVSDETYKFQSNVLYQNIHREGVLI